MSIKFVASTVLNAKDNTKGVFRQMAKNARNAESAVRALTVAGRRLKTMGSSMTRNIGAPAAAMGANSLRMLMNFEEAMNNTQAKLLATTESMKALRDQAKDMGATTAFSASQAANAQGFLAQAGFNSEQIMSSLPHTLNLAAAANMDLAEAADIASNVMGAFQLLPDKAGKNIQRTADVMALASAKSNLSVQELAEAMKQGAPIAKAFGADLESTSAIMGMLANMGIKGTDAGTAYKNMMVNLANPVGQAGKAMQKLNLQQGDFFKKNEEGKLIFKGIANMLDVLDKSGASATDRLNIFGKIAGPKMLALAGAGGDAIKQLEQDLRRSGASAQMAQIQMQGLPGVWKSLVSSWEAVNIALTESGALDVIIDAAKKLTGWLQRAAKSNPELIRNLALLAAGAATLGPALIALGGTLASVAVIAKTFAAAFALVSAMASPVVLAIAAVAGAAYLIYTNWEPIKQWFVDTWNFMKFITVEAVEGIKNLILAMNPVQWLTSTWSGTSEFFAGLKNRFLQWGSDLMNGLKQGIKNKIGEVKASIAKAAAEIKGKFTGIFKIRSPSQVFASYGGDMMQGLANGIKNNRAPIASLSNMAGNMQGLMGAANSPVFNSSPAALSSIDNRPMAPAIGSGMAGAIDARISIKVESGEDLRVSQSGVETETAGSLIRDVGVAVV